MQVPHPLSESQNHWECSGHPNIAEECGVLITGGRGSGHTSWPSWDSVQSPGGGQGDPSTDTPETVEHDPAFAGPYGDTYLMRGRKRFHRTLMKLVGCTTYSAFRFFLYLWREPQAALGLDKIRVGMPEKRTTGGYRGR